MSLSHRKATAFVGDGGYAPLRLLVIDWAQILPLKKIRRIRKPVSGRMSGAHLANYYLL